jgi:hypothetical protein
MDVLIYNYFRSNSVRTTNSISLLSKTISNEMCKKVLRLHIIRERAEIFAGHHHAMRFCCVLVCAKRERERVSESVQSVSPEHIGRFYLERGALCSARRMTFISGELTGDLAKSNPIKSVTQARLQGRRARAFVRALQPASQPHRYI